MVVSSKLAKYVTMMMHNPASISVALNSCAANVVRSPSCEKLLCHHHGSSLVSAATVTPDITNKGSIVAMAFALSDDACMNPRYDATPANAPTMPGISESKRSLPIIVFTAESSAYDMKNAVAENTTDNAHASITRRSTRKGSRRSARTALGAGIMGVRA